MGQTTSVLCQNDNIWMIDQRIMSKCQISNVWRQYSVTKWQTEHLWIEYNVWAFTKVYYVLTAEIWNWAWQSTCYYELVILKCTLLTIMYCCIDMVLMVWFNKLRLWSLKFVCWAFALWVNGIVQHCWCCLCIWTCTLCT